MTYTKKDIFAVGTTVLEALKKSGADMSQIYQGGTTTIDPQIFKNISGQYAEMVNKQKGGKMTETQTTERLAPLCTRCKQVEGETVPIGTFKIVSAHSTVCGKMYSHTCGCITTAHCEHGVGSPEADKYFGTFGSIEEIKNLFPKIELSIH